MYDGIIQQLIDDLGQLPGIGPKSAQRIAFHILENPNFDVESLASSLLEVRRRVKYCDICGNVSEEERCRICLDPRRSEEVLCLVEKPKDILAIERTREYRGKYHVLGGVLSPIDGIGPEQLRIRQLMERLANPALREIIIATNPTMEGEATASYLIRSLSSFDVRVSKLASGLPVGTDLEFADEITLGRAFEGRRVVNEAAI